MLGARPLRRTIQREIEDSLSEKILFGELKAGQIVIVDVEGTGQEAEFTFKGVPKPGAVPDTPPAEIAIESKAAARRDRRAPDQRRVTPPGQRLSSPCTASCTGHRGCDLRVGRISRLGEGCNFSVWVFGRVEPAGDGALDGSLGARPDAAGPGRAGW